MSQVSTPLVLPLVLRWLHDIRIVYGVGRATIDKGGLERLGVLALGPFATSVRAPPFNPVTTPASAMATHRADASTFLDNRGYSGPLVRGVNPVTLFEKAVRDRITDSYYWKEQCFGLNAATLCDRAVELSSIGGTYGISEKPSPFLCLAFKLLQLNPERDVVLEYLNFTDPGSDDEGDDPAHNGVVKGRGDFKYLRALGAFYVRLTFEAVDVYKTLEPLLLDYRKLKRRVRDTYTLTYMDQFIDDLLTKDRVCGTSLWKLPSRQQLEDLDMLDERISPLADELEELDRDSDEERDDADHDSGDNESSGKRSGGDD
ncbi:Pre-mRNA-splicing factor [Penicillium macrosclerotiorum]|uniref:Pre-mRNA-splicing factor n=1 Tax=Penicillium macrosclerotiorum TaxID=303699 RepID=UPI002546C961|nr:Pre-mRNA-splicing factor [Penicillium macrosclerotiorum]KAJ5689178.1 Pre-mRNA-splicing factor [Penicillium macrosclerotiorum]